MIHPLPDLSGQTFTRLTVVGKAPHTRRSWACECACGNTRTVPTCDLLNGHTKSCGCLGREMWSQIGAKAVEAHRIDLTNQRFGRLLALKIIEQRKVKSGTRVFWECLCDCGKTTKVESYKLRTGHTQSCGCLWKHYWITMLHDKSQTERARFKHLPEYGVWLHMKQRCYNATDRAYLFYGGRGITVCERWKHSFQAFYADKGPRPSPQHSLDRYPDHNGPYSPENTRWATKREQACNRRSNRVITYRGRTLCVAAWADELGLSRWKAMKVITSGESIAICESRQKIS